MGEWRSNSENLFMGWDGIMLEDILQIAHKILFA
jgi:hypothetical protein